MSQLVETDNRLAAAGVGLSRQLSEKASPARDANQGDSVEIDIDQGIPTEKVSFCDVPCLSKLNDEYAGAAVPRQEAVSDAKRVSFDHVAHVGLRFTDDTGMLNIHATELAVVNNFSPTEGSRQFRTGAYEEESIRFVARTSVQMTGSMGNSGSSTRKPSYSGFQQNIGFNMEQNSKTKFRPYCRGTALDTRISSGRMRAPKRRPTCVCKHRAASIWSDASCCCRSDLLQPNACVRPLLCTTQLSEAVPQKNLWPTALVLQPPKTRRRRVTQDIGTSSLGSFEGAHMLSDLHHAPLQRCYSAQSRLNHNALVWSTAKPHAAHCAPQLDDAMSDTESDEENNSISLEWPTQRSSETFCSATICNPSFAALSLCSGAVMLPQDRTAVLLGQRRFQDRAPLSGAVPSFISQVESALDGPSCQR